LRQVPILLLEKKEKAYLSISDVCHFVDYLTFINGSVPRSMHRWGHPLKGTGSRGKGLLSEKDFLSRFSKIPGSGLYFVVYKTIIKKGIRLSREQKGSALDIGHHKHSFEFLVSS
jgi:hypothetical protein